MNSKEIITSLSKNKLQNVNILSLKNIHNIHKNGFKSPKSSIKSPQRQPKQSKQSKQISQIDVKNQNKKQLKYMHKDKSIKNYMLKSPNNKKCKNQYMSQFQTPFESGCFLTKGLSPKTSIYTQKITNQKKKNSKQKIQKEKSPRMRITSPFNLGSNSNKSSINIKTSLANIIKIYHPSEKQKNQIKVTQRSSTRQISKDNTCMSSKNLIQKQPCKCDFKYTQIIGQGGYGKVWQVQHIKKKKYYALKQMSKAMILMKKGIDNVMNQLQILQKINSPFIANMVCAFNDRQNLYLVMDYLPGGDLRQLFGQVDKFSQIQTKFIIACIIQALEYIHQNKIIHRDIKPQNLVIDEKGYLRVTDFGVARWAKNQLCKDTSGTPGYMAPQVICKKGHSYISDFYAIGVIVYQLMLRKRPYRGTSRQQIRQLILSKQQSIKKNQIPQKWSSQSADFSNKLLTRNPQQRLGYKNGIKQLKQHNWFKKFNWKQLKNKKLQSPFKKRLNKMLNKSNNIMIQNYNQQVLMQYQLLKRAQQKLDNFSENYFSKFKDNKQK